MWFEMKRLRVDETLKEGSASSPSSATNAAASLYGQSLHHNAAAAIVAAAVSSSPLSYSSPNITSSSSSNVKVVSGESGRMQSAGLYAPSVPVSYAMPAVSAPHSVRTPVMQPMVVGGQSQLRTAGSSPPTAPIQDMQPQQAPHNQQQQSPGSNFQKLKVG